ncbi:MAG TPA: MBL fold metallo-hydrolase [Methylomirabilota bacterium]|jgi:glyoxylase-like metal-dependent hydrolase (beta-lactamase superfamily II)/rhodanese-related sulfurtransferase|nr:MBL fold metallo-hydrolase [Methylomirabilota bacterium]
MIFKPVPNEAAGCLAYLVGCEKAGVAAVIDPGRPDLDEYVALAEARGLTLTHVLDTHIHADHVSGNRELAARTGASLYLHEAADVRFPFRGLRDGDRLALGTVEVRVLHTPGHTPESMCLVVTDTTRGPEPWFAFTGDTLFVGDVGRPDFGGERAATELHRSLFERLLPLGDAVEVYPAHGAGSTCGRAMSAKVGSTIGFERRFNPALRHPAPDAFVRALLDGPPPRPPNMDRIIGKNKGVVMLKRSTPERLEARDLGARLQTGATLVDIRDPRAFGAGHVAGSLNIWIDSPQFAERVSWFVPPGRPLILLAESEADVVRAVGAFTRIGLDDVAAYVVGSPAVRASGLAVAELPNVTAPELGHRLAGDRSLVVLDVREPFEWDEGHVPGAVHIPMRQVTDRATELPRDRTIAVICRGGPRSSTVGSLLLTRGFTRLLNVWGGMTGWLEAGLPVEE